MSLGLNTKDIRELVPKIKIPEDAAISETEGWCRFEKPETIPEAYERAKEVMRIFKQMASGDFKGKTVFAVSHGQFMSALYCLIT